MGRATLVVLQTTSANISMVCHASLSKRPHLPLAAPPNVLFLTRVCFTAINKYNSTVLQDGWNYLCSISANHIDKSAFK